MKPTDTSQICPYTGLRSFTEEESLYFKGRDEQVDLVTAQLEERKFLMLTGASGEGKSSLIYAGLIPNARAGFFKARYGQWKVVDFRPERTPVENLSLAFANAFNANPGTIETEMRRGFSSLTDVYLNSDFYINEQDESWQALSDAEKKVKNRSASNLLILVDQFEEFFTNPENYHNQSPSQDSQIVVNLVLETARIAQQQNLPIYVVCTMRSDYIGQCSSFRGLAEYIGYSQFFVPRLKRKELKQVIEDPAVLSGNRITQRLTDRLVYDLSEGVDQLPILQHALSQIWLEASHGEEEMDLIHYAMVGGMPASELPPEDKIRFDQWFAALPEFQQHFYGETGLHKVIENHANRLYESAASTYNSEYPETITSRDAKNIIALTFSCLTKIDNSRAVRNRMTLTEIAGIINRPELSTAIIGKVLDIFREEGNSFIRPFKTDDNKNLSANSVLDITHESLIRNWGRLNKWASSEYTFYSTYLDLKKQLDRWKQNGKSSGYLLPIGPLTYFENWYATCRPNAGWINRYAERSEDNVATLKASENALVDITTYLNRSAKNVRISRAFVKYGAGTIALTISLVALLILCGWYWYDASQRKNANVIATVQKQASKLLDSRELDDEFKAAYLIAEERFAPGSIASHLETIQNREDKISRAIALYLNLELIEKKYSGPLNKQLIDLLGKNLAAEDGRYSFFNLTQRLKFIYLLAYNNYYKSDPEIQKILKQQSAELYNILLQFFNDPKSYNSNITGYLNQAIHTWLTFGNPSTQDVQKLVDLISPLSGDKAKSVFDTFYRKGSFEANGIRPLDFAGGHHTLASLYAALGDVEKVNWSLQQLKSQSDYWSGKLYNDYTNVVGYLYQYGHRAAVPPVLQEIENVLSTNTPVVVFESMLIKSGYITPNHRLNLFDRTRRLQTEDGKVYLNLCLADREQFKMISSDYEKAISQLPNVAERNYRLATHYKRVAIFDHKYHFDRGLPISTAYLDGLLDKAWQSFTAVPEEYISAVIPVSYTDIAPIIVRNVTRRENFVYPDYIGGAAALSYHSDLVYKYLEKRKLLELAYKTTSDLDQLHFWITNMAGISAFSDLYAMENNYFVSDSTLKSILAFATDHRSANFDGNQVYMILANRSFERGDTTAGIANYNKLDFQNFERSAARYDAWRRTKFRNEMKELATNLAVLGKADESIQMVERFETAIMKVNCYAFVARHTYDNNFDPMTFVYLDSAFSNAKRLPSQNVIFQLEFRGRLIAVTEKIGGEKMKALSNQISVDTREIRKLNTAIGMMEGNCERNDFYGAMTAISPTLTERQDILCKSVIMTYAARAKEKENNLPAWKAMDDLIDFNNYILFYGIVF